MDPTKFQLFIQTAVGMGGVTVQKKEFPLGKKNGFGFAVIVVKSYKSVSVKNNKQKKAVVTASGNQIIAVAEEMTDTKREKKGISRL